MFEILHELSNWIREFAETDWAILILFVTAFLESTISPIPPDPLLIPMAIIKPSSAIWLAALCTLASVLGAVLGHWLGSQFGRPLLGKFVSESRIQSGETLFDKYGIWAVLVAAVTPIPYKVFTILAGVLKLDMKRFLIASIIGPEFDSINVQNLADNVGSIVQKLNTTYQQQLTDEYEAFSLFMN